jgi:hypothetical protein
MRLYTQITKTYTSINKIQIIVLMMEAARTSETLVNFYQTIRRYNTEDKIQLI